MFSLLCVAKRLGALGGKKGFVAAILYRVFKRKSKRFTTESTEFTEKVTEIHFICLLCVAKRLGALGGKKMVMISLFSPLLVA